MTTLQYLDQINSSSFNHFCIIADHSHHHGAHESKVFLLFAANCKHFFSLKVCGETNLAPQPYLQYLLQPLYRVTCFALRVVEARTVANRRIEDFYAGARSTHGL